MITSDDISVSSTVETSPFDHTRIKADFYVVSVAQLTIPESHPSYGAALAVTRERARQEVWDHLYGSLLKGLHELSWYGPFIDNMETQMEFDTKVRELIKEVTYV